ncbi:CTH1 [Symbiodinium microadriaticum]|nr:CTH1 [Symbiodinium microadriaticum]CAE7904833.1 CTH1 [Symbiodinium sp. KB8]
MEKRQPVKRTELCAFFAAGMCTRGSRCTFAHGAAQLRPRPDLYKTRLCDSWALLRRCPYGDRCTHAHGEEELRAVDDLEARELIKEVSSTASGDCEPELPLSSTVTQFGLPRASDHRKKYVGYDRFLLFDGQADYPITTPDDIPAPWSGIPYQPHPSTVQANMQAMQLFSRHAEVLSL